MFSAGFFIGWNRHDSRPALVGRFRIRVFLVGWYLASRVSSFRKSVVLLRGYEVIRVFALVLGLFIGGGGVVACDRVLARPDHMACLNHQLATGGVAGNCL